MFLYDMFCRSSHTCSLKSLALALSVTSIIFLQAPIAANAQTPPDDSLLDAPPLITEEASPAEQPKSINDIELDPNLFFDAEETISVQSGGTQGSLGRVNPMTEPGSKFIFVTKDHEPTSRKAQLVAAERASKLGRHKAALNLYNALYQNSPRDAKVLLGRAITLQHLGHIESAILAYEELLDIQPDNIDANVNMLGLMGARYPAVALRRLVELRQRYPSNVGVVAQLASVYAALRHYDEALGALELAATLEPENAGHVFNIAVIADKAGRKDMAVKYYEQALEVDTIYGGGRSIPREEVFERLASLR